jgi:hypothetical protein
MARKTKTDLAKFQSDVQRSVRRLRQEVKNKIGEFRADMAGAREAWSELTAPVAETLVIEAGAEMGEARAPREKKRRRR